MSEDNGRKKYSKKVRSMVVDIEEHNGETRTYMLRGLLGPERDEWIELQGKLVKDGQFTEKGAQTRLIAKLLSLTLIAPEGSPVDEAEVATFPSETQLGLFQDALSISGLDAFAKQAAKNA